MYEAGLISVIAALVLFIKLPTHWLRRLLWMDFLVDLTVTLGFAATLAGTYSGMTAAIAAGLMFSIVLWITKQFMGYEKLRFKSESWEFYWVQVPGAWAKR